MERKPDFTEVLEVASEAGHILLENGAEISRVEDIMARIATHFGVDTGNFFILSNGIFTTGKAGKVEKAGGQASTYANVEFIPLKGVQLSKVVAVNRLSYDIAAGRCDLEEARERLKEIRETPLRPAWKQVLCAALGASGFCAVFGGGFLDCAAALAVGLLVQIFILAVSSRYLSKIVGGICNALLASLLCIASWRVGFGTSLSNIIIGVVMLLVPGVPFVNGVRDLANSDYLAGLTRMTDALLRFFCIALGVSVSFIIDGGIFEGFIKLQGVTVNPETAGFFWQTLAAFIATAAFAVLYEVNKTLIPVSGLTGALGWVAYLLLLRFAGATPTVAVLGATLLVCLFARFAAVPFRSPGQVFLLCGILPLVPGAGLFWFTYYITSEQFPLAQVAGFDALKAAIAIVLGIVLAMELPQRIFSRRHA